MCLNLDLGKNIFEEKGNLTVNRSNSITKSLTFSRSECSNSEIIKYTKKFHSGIFHVSSVVNVSFSMK